MNNVLNVAAYRFVALPDAAAWRDRIAEAARGAGVRGTVLLAEEGINFFLAGAPGAVRSLLAWLQAEPRFAGLDVKESWSAEVPFRRLLVKVKREIIRMNHPAIQPQGARAPAVDAATLRRWLDDGHDAEGRPVVMLDTRNAFEVDQGAFDGAIDWRLHRFSEFPDAVDRHRTELQGKTVVSYCTGGIRCEKAALYLQERGVDHVWQLEGGILRYFEETGGAHFHGTCFVFDEREGVDAELKETRSGVIET